MKLDYSAVFSAVYGPLLWLALFTVVTGLLKSRWFKGMFGEFLVKLIARFKLPAETYHPIHNVTLPTPDGTTQIDHVFVSRFGIFVVETKHMTGWIFGSETQPQWTQKIYKQSFKFQNPLRQNYKHVKALQDALDVPPAVIHSLVVFTGGSRFKTPMPAHVTHGVGYIRYITSFTDPVLSEKEVQQTIAQIQSGRLAPTRKTHREHVQNLKTRSDPAAERKCPKCGSPMLLRTRKKGANAGTQFWGCSAFPKCRIVQDFS